MAIDSDDVNKARVGALGRDVDVPLDAATLPTTFTPGGMNPNVLSTAIGERVINRVLNSFNTRITNAVGGTEAFDDRFNRVVGNDATTDQADFDSLGGNLIHVVAGIVAGGPGGAAMPEPPDDDKPYARRRATGATTGSWHIVTGADGIPEPPSDGKLYGRAMVMPPGPQRWNNQYGNSPINASYTVPMTGWYQIMVAGAGGGSAAYQASHSYYRGGGGSGGVIYFRVQLNAGDVLSVHVGERGTRGTETAAMSTNYGRPGGTTSVTFGAFHVTADSGGGGTASGSTASPGNGGTVAHSWTGVTWLNQQNGKQGGGMGSGSAGDRVSVTSSLFQNSEYIESGRGGGITGTPGSPEDGEGGRVTIGMAQMPDGGSIAVRLGAWVEALAAVSGFAEPPDTGSLYARARVSGAETGGWHTLDGIISAAVTMHDDDPNAHDDIRTLIANLSTGGGGGTATWGVITGTLEDQADLKIALEAKASVTGSELTHDLWVQGSRITGSVDAARLTGSIYGINYGGGNVTANYLHATSGSLGGDIYFSLNTGSISGQVFNAAVDAHTQVDDAGYYVVTTSGTGGLRRLSTSGYPGSRIEGSLGYNFAMSDDTSSRSYYRFVVTSGRGIGHYWSNIGGSYISVSNDVTNADASGTSYPQVIVTSGSTGMERRSGIPSRWVNTGDLDQDNYGWIVTTSGSGLRRMSVAASGLGSYISGVGGSQVITNGGNVDSSPSSYPFYVVTSGNAGNVAFYKTYIEGSRISGALSGSIPTYEADSNQSSYPYYVVTSGSGIAHYKTYVEGSRVSGSLGWNVTIGGSSISQYGWYDVGTSFPSSYPNVCVTSGSGMMYTTTKTAGMEYERVHNGTGNYGALQEGYEYIIYNTEYIGTGPTPVNTSCFSISGIAPSGVAFAQIKCLGTTILSGGPGLSRGYIGIWYRWSDDKMVTEPFLYSFPDVAGTVSVSSHSGRTYRVLRRRLLGVL